MSELKRMSEKRFLDNIYDGYKAGERYCFVLGAGASRTSGIRTGEELMREWRDYLSEKGKDYIAECARELNIADYEKIFEDGYELQNDDYFTLFDLRFAGHPNIAFAYLEKEMKDIYPSYGYYPLSMILANTENKLVITTNFDSLLEDALFIYRSMHPLVVGHESLATFVNNDARRPVVAKIHRDLLFQPKNRKEDMKKLADGWEEPLKKALSKYIPIIIGYAGGDHTFMSLLEKINIERIYWCSLSDNVDEKISEVIKRHNGYLVKISGFDEVMFQMGEYFKKEAEIGDGCKHMEEETARRCERHMKKLDEIRSKYDIQKKRTGNSSRTPEQNESISNMIRAISEYDKGTKDKDDRTSAEVEKKIIDAKIAFINDKYDKALNICNEIIQLSPDQAEIYDIMSAIYHYQKDYEEALEAVNKAIEIEPDKAEYYDSRGVTLHVMKRYSEALEDSNKAIELEPDKAEYYDSRGVTLHAMKRYSEALEDSNKAIELEPDNAEYYDSRGITLHEMGRYEESLQDKDKAIELNPTNALYYYSRSITLNKIGNPKEALADIDKAIELAPDNEEYKKFREDIVKALDNE